MRNKKNQHKKGKEGINMAVMTKPLNISLRVRSEKTDEFLGLKRDTRSLLKKFQRLRNAEINSGKSESDQHIAFLDKKIKEFKDELQE